MDSVIDGQAWENIFSAGPVSIFVWENKTGEWPVLKVTDNIETLTGWKPEDFLSGGKGYAELIHEADLARVGKEEDAWKAKKSKDNINMNYRIVTKFGAVRHVSEYTQNIFDDEGEITHLVGYLVDMTRVREEEAKRLADQENEAFRMLSEVTDSMSYGIIVFGKENLELVNRAARDILGMSESELLVGKPWRNQVPRMFELGFDAEDQDPEAVVQKIISDIESGTAYTAERLTRKGRRVRIDAVPHPEYGMICNCTDITEAKEREAQLEETSFVLKQTTDAMVQGIIVFHNGRLTFYNPTLLQLLDIRDNELPLGISFDDYIDVLHKKGHLGEGDEGEQKRAYLSDLVKQGKPYRLDRTMASGKTLQIDSVPLENNSAVVAYSDITDSKKREEDLKNAMVTAESAERAKSEFLANMSHEIRTPMNGVMGMAELLVTTDLDAKQKMFTDVIVKSGASLLTIINDILDFSKIDAGQMELDPAPFTLAEAIEDVAALISAKVAEKDLELIVRVEPTLPKVLVGDVGRIRQIVTNLMGNAVKFTEKGHVYVNVEGQIVESANGNVAELKFQVEDTGIGIPEEQCETVFQKFSQVDTSATRKHEGTGLGLSIASSLVELMGGQIGVESAVGKGSTFWFTVTLPVHSDVSNKRAIPHDLSGARVLIIDDNRVNRSILTEQFTAWQFDNAAVSNGKDGLKFMHAATASGVDLDLVVLDYQMPEMSGAEVLQIMRDDPALRDIPVVVLSSVDSAQINQKLTRLGAAANLTKPMRSSLLLETVLQVIANHKVERSAKLDLDLTEENGSSVVPHAGQEPLIESAHQPNSEPGDIQTGIETSSRNNGLPQRHAAESRLDVLIAEDNEVNQIVFQQIIEETGLAYKIVENGRLAFASYKIQNPRLILMDVSMPEMNGKEATAAIREYEQDNKTGRTPIVGVTAHALKGDMESCLDAGMDDYLSKPVSPEKLKAKIQQWLQSEPQAAANT